MIFSILFPKCKVFDKAKDVTKCDYYLGLSTNRLVSFVVNDKGFDISEVICNGDDMNGYLLGFDDIDDMLDTLLVLKEEIQIGNNPIITCGLVDIPFNH